ncbi:6,7-dimethyl-8-ribityllumazine synthase [Elusimicrobiota bacterium]
MSKKSIKSAPKLTISIIASEFNDEVISRMLASAKNTLMGSKKPQIRIKEVIRVPGCFEIPFTAKQLSKKTPKLDAIIALGVIIKGKTSQDKHLARACMTGLELCQMESGIPIGTGIITANTRKQAMARTKGNLDRGKEAALAAIHMARLNKTLK